MRTQLAITDLTHMWGDQVCIAGVDGAGNCVRPVKPNGVRRHDLIKQGTPLIYPRAVVELDLSDTAIAPPHVEDKLFAPNSVKLLRECSDAEFEQGLRDISFGSVAEMFDGHLEASRRVAPGAPTRSLGTLADVELEGVTIDDRYDRRRFRLDFVDPSGKQYVNYPINDLAFRGYGASLTGEGIDYREVEIAAMTKLTSARRMYLRIGPARPAQLGDYPETCWVQVTGIHTFPDYLEGRTFADFN